MIWEQAKADAQETEMAIARLIHQDRVANIDQHESGSLFSCDETRHQWTGITYVTLAPGSDVEGIVKDMQGRLGEVLRTSTDFTVTSYRDMFDDYTVEAQARASAEAYLFGADDDKVISIESWSVCFTLPEGVYPGGKF